MRDRFSGQPRGFGFVEVNNDDDASRAIQSLNGQDFMGRNVVVNEARPPREGGGGGGGGAVAVAAVAAVVAVAEAVAVVAGAEAVVGAEAAAVERGATNH